MVFFASCKNDDDTPIPLVVGDLENGIMNGILQQDYTFDGSAVELDMKEAGF